MHADIGGAMDEERNEIAEKLRSICIDRHLTFTEVAKKAGYHRTVVARRADRNYSSPKLPTLKDIAQALGYRLEVRMFLVPVDEQAKMECTTTDIRL